MPPRIAIPMSHSTDREYGERAIPQYERAVSLAGGEPVRIPLDQSEDVVKHLIATCDAVLLPGSNADIDPARFHAPRSPHTASADLRREAVDDLLLDDAYAHRKPILGICYGLQSLNVYRNGSLIQHIPDFLSEATRARVNHEAGRKVAVAHTVEIERASRLASILGKGIAEKPALGNTREGHGFRFEPALSERSESKGANDAPQGNEALAAEADNLILPVNSSHHQSADAAGPGLRIVAHCPDDGIIEALEGTDRNHFVVAVQWHPERSVDDDEPSRAIFRALIEAAENRD